MDPAGGLLVSPEAPVALADALRRLIARPLLRERLGAAGPAHARALCDPHQQAARLRDVLATVTRSTPG